MYTWTVCVDILFSPVYIGYHSYPLQTALTFDSGPRSLMMSITYLFLLVRFFSGVSVEDEMEKDEMEGMCDNKCDPNSIAWPQRPSFVWNKITAVKTCDCSYC